MQSEKSEAAAFVSLLKDCSIMQDWMTVASGSQTPNCDAIGHALSNPLFGQSAQR